MHVLRIDHATSDYAQWKQAFDSDPADRAGSGVRHHRVLRGPGDDGAVSIELVFDSADAADAMLAKLRPVWQGLGGTLISSPSATVLELMEEQAY
jgi:hypothetical protein